MASHKLETRELQNSIDELQTARAIDRNNSTRDLEALASSHHQGVEMMKSAFAAEKRELRDKISLLESRAKR